MQFRLVLIPNTWIRLNPFGLVSMDSYMFNSVLLEDESKALSVSANIQFLHVADKIAGLDSHEATAGFTAFGGIGGFVVCSDKYEQFAVFSIYGRMISCESVASGVEKRIFLSASVYVMKVVKLVVR